MESIYYYSPAQIGIKGYPGGTGACLHNEADLENYAEKFGLATKGREAVSQANACIQIGVHIRQAVSLPRRVVTTPQATISMLNSSRN